MGVHIWVEAILLFLLREIQCIGSGLDPDSIRSVDPYPESGSRRAKILTKIEKNWEISCFVSAGCSLLRAEGFFCSMDVLYGSLRIGKLQFLIKKIFDFFSSCNFFRFLVIKILDPDRYSFKMLDPDPDQVNTDPKHRNQLLNQVSLCLPYM